MKIIGYEGYLYPNAIMEFGAAAITDKDICYNSVTKLSCSLESINYLVENKQMYLFNSPIEVEDAWNQYAIVINKYNKYHSYAICNNYNIIDDGSCLIIICDYVNVKKYADLFCENVLILPEDTQGYLKIIRAAYAINPTHPEMSALNFMHDNSRFSKAMYLSLLDESEIYRFNNYLKFA